MASARLAPLLLLALLLCGLAASARAQDGEQPSDGIADAAADAAAADGAAKPRRQRPPFILRQQDSWVMEGCAVAVLLVFLVNVFIGRRRNERLALAWTSEVRRRQAGERSGRSAKAIDAREGGIIHNPCPPHGLPCAPLLRSSWRPAA